MRHINTSNTAALETALESAPLGTVADVTVADETLTVRRVPGGWYLEGDLTVTSGDIADAGPRAVVLR